MSALVGVLQPIIRVILAKMYASSSAYGYGPGNSQQSSFSPNGNGPPNLPHQQQPAGQPQQHMMFNPQQFAAGKPSPYGAGQPGMGGTGQNAGGMVMMQNNSGMSQGAGQHGM